MRNLQTLQKRQTEGPLSSKKRNAIFALTFYSRHASILFLVTYSTMCTLINDSEGLAVTPYMEMKVKFSLTSKTDCTVIEAS